MASHGLIGVGKSRRKFGAKMQVRGKTQWLGSWPTARQAALARDRAALHFGLSARTLALASEARRLGPLSPQELRQLAAVGHHDSRKARWLGVSQDPAGGWVACVRANGRSHRIPGYRDATDAALARDRLAVGLLGSRAKLNFSRDEIRPASMAELVRELYGSRKRGRSSRYWGVRRRSRSWAITVARGRNTYSLAGFRSETEAAQARDRLVLHLRGDAALLNFPRRRLEPASYDELSRELLLRVKSQTSSRYRGVNANGTTASKPWNARMTDPMGVPHMLGCWSTERSAALAVDRARLHFGMVKGLNLPRLSRERGPADPATLRAEAHEEFKAATQSRFRGIFRNHGAWSAAIGHRGEYLYLGTFEDEETAASAYDRAALRLHRAKARLNFDPVTGEELLGARPLGGVAGRRRATRSRNQDR
jgi:hypothetical protein